MTMKTCKKCGETFPASGFYRQKGNSDGRSGTCKECCKARVRENYRRNRDHYIAYERRRGQRPKRKQSVNRRHLSWRKANPDARAAHVATGNAIRDGRLVRGPCEECGASKVEAHHDDYLRPLDVRWLCRRHHLAIHGKVAWQ